MKTLVIFTPTSKAQSEGKRNFRDTINKKVGEGYAIASTEYAQIKPGWNVIVQDIEMKRQAKGRLVELKQLPEAEKTDTGMWRYDVCMEHLVETDGYDFIPIPMSQKAQRYRGILII